MKRTLNIFADSAKKIDPTSAFQSLVSLYSDTTRVIEEEKTKRDKIQAERDVKLEAIKLQRDFFMQYLEKTYDERKENFAKLFMVIDDAIKKDNIQQLTIGLGSLNKLAAESPFKVIADINALSDALDKKVEFDF